MNGVTWFVLFAGLSLIGLIVWQRERFLALVGWVQDFLAEWDAAGAKRRAGELERLSGEEKVLKARVRVERERKKLDDLRSKNDDPLDGVFDMKR